MSDNNESNNNVPAEAPAAPRPIRRIRPPSRYTPPALTPQIEMHNGTPFDHYPDSHGTTPSQYFEQVRVLTNRVARLVEENGRLYTALYREAVEDRDADEPIHYQIYDDDVEPPTPPRRTYWMPDGIVLCPCCDYPMNVGQRTCGPNCVDLSY